jgi:hypothetical protein
MEAAKGTPSIRNKGTSQSVIDENLKAAANEAQKAKASPSVQMKSIDEMYPSQDETIVAQKFKVKPSPPRSPAPLPEAVSPAGIPISVERTPNSASPLRKTIASPLPEGEVKIEIAGLEDLDLSMEGKGASEYKRNKKGTGIVALLLFIGFNLFVNHMFMFSWVMEFNSSQVAIAAIFYFISSFFVLGTMAVSLVKPAFSIGSSDLLYKYYFLIAVAGLLDLLAILMGGSIFGPFIIYSQLSTSYLNMNTIAILLSIIINAGLFVAFTKPDGSACAKYFHPFERIDAEEHQSETQDNPIKQNETAAV